MRKILISAILLIGVIGYTAIDALTEPGANPTSDSRQLYMELGLDKKVEFSAFCNAIEGHKKVNSKNKEIITLIDFSKPSTVERLFVIDLKHKRVLYSSHVSHGKNSGDTYATSFSNVRGSNKSSLGFYLTGNPYKGRNGYSLELHGQEKGINDKARERAIVIHGADYCNPEFLSSAGRLGRSQGCPALPRAVNELIINTIKGGSLLYIHANDPQYITQSTILSPHVASL